MPHTLLSTVREVLESQGPWTSKILRVAYSGGVDSTVLVDVLKALQPDLGYHLHLMHIHHGLQKEADDWVVHCETNAKQWGLKLEVVRLHLSPPFPGGLEAFARQKRYEALSASGADWVALAHHADDQVETVLLQWLRGAGLAGLAGMGLNERSDRHPLTLPLLRPLLAIGREEIEAYARGRGLSWITDPSNLHVDRDRNYLRQEIMPRLKSRFPGLLTGVQRSQSWIQESLGLLHDLALVDGQKRSPPPFSDPCCLPGSLEDYCQLSPSRFRNLLRLDLAQRAFTPPPGERLLEWSRQVFSAGYDRLPKLSWEGGVLRRWRDSLWLESVDPALDPKASDDWLLQSTPKLAWAQGGQIWVGEEAPRPGDLTLPMPLKPIECVTVRFIEGGLVLRPGPLSPSKDLRKLCQEAGIPPWRRARLPGFWVGDTLVAVPGLGVNPEFQAHPGEPGLRITWRDPALCRLSW